MKNDVKVMGRTKSVQHSGENVMNSALSEKGPSSLILAAFMSEVGHHVFMRKKGPAHLRLISVHDVAGINQSLWLSKTGMNGRELL